MLLFKKDSKVVDNLVDLLKQKILLIKFIFTMIF